MPRTANDPRILRVQPLRPRGLRVRLHLDRGEPLEVALEALERSKLGVGDPLPANRLHHLQSADADVRVREAALSLLSYRARTRVELRRKLTTKGFRPARIDHCLERLTEKGLLDDEAVAAAFVRDRLRLRPRGKVRLAQELRAKGIEGDLAHSVIDRVLDDERVTEDRLTLEVAQGWLARQGPTVREALAASDRSTESDKSRRRLRAYLARRGFRGSHIRDAMAELTEEKR